MTPPKPPACDCGIERQGHVGEHLAGCPAKPPARSWKVSGKLLAKVNPTNEPWVEVIEKSAYTALEEKLARAEKLFEDRNVECSKLLAEKKQVECERDEALKQVDVSNHNRMIVRQRERIAELETKLSRTERALEYLISMLPEECTAGFVAHARAIAGGNQAEIERTK